MLIDQLSALCAERPALRRFEERGFELMRPVLNLELEIPIETINQRLLVNVETGEFQSLCVNPA